MDQSLIQFYEGLDTAAISEERREKLLPLINQISDALSKNDSYQLSFICTHNSRRSVFGQVSACIAFEAEGLDIACYSAGTEETAVHANTLKTLRSIGIEFDEHSRGRNSIYECKIGDQNLSLFSKTITHPSHPQKNFSAVMTCSDAGENCPFIPGADLRANLYYVDPKTSDGQPNEDEVYLAKLREIGCEMKYVAQTVKHNLAQVN